jgi:diguanylate cyclase (GGDEF)-like protein/PAS domain S-box-containing protein
MSRKQGGVAQQAPSTSTTRSAPVLDSALQSQLAATIEATPDGVALVDSQGGFRYLNPAGRALLGLGAAEELSPFTLLDFCPASVRTQIQENALPTAVTTGQWSSETELKDRTGRTFSVRLVFFAHKESDATVSFLSLIIRDISDQKRREAELAHLAHHDALTGLFNRRRFQEELDNRLAHVRRYGGHGTLLLLDVDGFKAVNDTFGHQAGDVVLKALANLLQEQLRQVDVVARLGGDEFAALLHTPDMQQAAAVAGRLLNAVQKHTVTIDQHTLRCTISIGIALFPEHGSTNETIMEHADLALYRAKTNGRDQYQMFSPALAQ